MIILRTLGTDFFSGVNKDALKDSKNEGPYCGSCYGAERSAEECCNTCEEVRDAYLRKGWGFNADGVVQVGITP